MRDRTTVSRPSERAAVVGLGRFGTSLARTLAKLGYEVTAIDPLERPVAEIADVVTLAAQGDGTDEALLRSLGVDGCRYGVVASGENVEVSVLATFALKRIGVPWIVAKATGPVHAALLYRVGADRVVSPEDEAGQSLAHTISVRHVRDYIPLTATGGIAKVDVPTHAVGCSIGELCAPLGGRLDIVVIQRNGQVLTNPDPSERLRAGDTVAVAGEPRR